MAGGLVLRAAAEGDLEDQGSIEAHIKISMVLDTESIDIDPNPQIRHKQNLYEYFFGHLGKT